MPRDSALPRAASLEWISITSPDFAVVEPLKSKEPPMFRAQIGLDPKSHLPLIAVIWQDEHGAMVAETATLVDFVNADSFKLIDGHLAATSFREHDPALPSSPFAFQRKRRELRCFVDKDGARLRPKLTPDDFQSPKQ